MNYIVWCSITFDLIFKTFKCIDKHAHGVFNTSIKVFFFKCVLLAHLISSFLFQSEWEALEIVEHKWALENVEEDLMSRDLNFRGLFTHQAKTMFQWDDSNVAAAALKCSDEWCWWCLVGVNVLWKMAAHVLFLELEGLNIKV